MCSLCGVLGGRGHWTETATHPEVFANREETHTRRRERQQRTRLANAVLAHYGLVLQDWAASSYVLRSRTGRTEMVDDLSQLWDAAERLAGRACDPLDGDLLTRLDAHDQ